MTKSIVQSYSNQIKRHDVSNVGIYFHSLAGKGGGAERQLISLAEALASRGYNVHIITWDEANSSSFFNIPDGIRWHKLGSGTNLSHKVKRLRRLTTVLKKNKIKVLIGFVMANNKVLILGALLSGTKLIAAERNGPSLYHIKHTFLGRWMNFLSLLTCRQIVLQFDEFKSGYPKVLHNRICVIPNPIFTSKKVAKPASIKKLTFQILFVGRLDSVQKQPLLLAQAFEKIARKFPNWNLVIVGSGDALNSLEKFIAKAALENRIDLIPATLEVEKFYESSDLFVIPSLWEGAPNSLSEAMSHGLPAIGFKVDGVTQLIRHGITGWLAPFVNDISLSETLEVALSAPNKLTKMGKAAKKKALSINENTIYNRWHKLIISIQER